MTRTTYLCESSLSELPMEELKKILSEIQKTTKPHIAVVIGESERYGKAETYLYGIFQKNQEEYSEDRSIWKSDGYYMSKSTILEMVEKEIWFREEGERMTSLYEAGNWKEV